MCSYVLEQYLSRRYAMYIPVHCVHRFSRVTFARCLLDKSLGCLPSRFAISYHLPLFPPCGSLFPVAEYPRQYKLAAVLSCSFFFSISYASLYSLLRFPWFSCLSSCDLHNLLSPQCSWASILFSVDFLMYLHFLAHVLVIFYACLLISLWFPTVSYQFLLKASKQAIDLYFGWQALEITMHAKVNQGIGKSPYGNGAKNGPLKRKADVILYISLHLPFTPISLRKDRIPLFFPILSLLRMIWILKKKKTRNLLNVLTFSL